MNRKLFIYAIFLLAVLGGYGLYWHHQANALRELTAHIISQYTTKVAAQSPRVKLEYERLALGGFPFTTRVIIRQPRILADDITQQLEISAAKIVVTSQASDNSVLKFSLPKRFTAEQRQHEIRKHYDINLNESPALLVTLTGKSEKMGSNASARTFAPALPKQLVLSFQLNELHRDISFDLAMMQLPIWQNVRYDVGPLSSFFFSILEEAASRVQ